MHNELHNRGSAVAVNLCGECDDDSLYAAFHGFEGVLYLRHHAAGDGAVGNVAFVVGTGDGGDDAVVVVGVGEDTLFLEGEDEGDVEVLGECLGNGGGHRVGIGVEDVALTVVRQRCYDGGDAGVEELGEAVAVGTVHVADEAEVYHLLRAVVEAHFLERTLVGAYHVHVGTGESECAYAVGPELRHDVLVDESAVYHGDDAEHLAVRDASSAHHVCLDAECLGGGGGASSAAVNEEFLALNGREVLYQCGELPGVFHDSAANFDDSKFFHIVCI